MWSLIVALLLLGLALIIIEIVFVPGTTIVGIIGVILAGAGILITFRHYGSESGYYLLIGSSIVTMIALYFSFRSNAWSKFANKSSMKSKVNEGLIQSLQLGDEGVTLSTLKPMGTVQFKSGQFEVKSLGDYVDVGTKVRIIHIQSNQIIVKPLN